MIAPNRRAHVLQHVPFEGLGSIEPWLVTAGYSITWTRFFTGGNLPAPDDPDLLIVLGGPMSVNDETAFPWLRDEKRFVRRSIEAGVPLLGICLGAQLIASALDARVYPNRHREIGWFPVYRTPDEPGVFPERFDAFHWHGETFDLPSGAALLARSAAGQLRPDQRADGETPEPDSLARGAAAGHAGVNVPRLDGSASGGSTVRFLIHRNLLTVNAATVHLRIWSDFRSAKTTIGAA